MKYLKMRKLFSQLVLETFKVARKKRISSDVVLATSVPHKLVHVLVMISEFTNIRIVT